MEVEVINTGTELLLGAVLTTHLRFLAQELFPLGLRVTRQVTVPDGPDIRMALVESFARAGIVIVTGGLGPTTDDITREVTADLLGLELESTMKPSWRRLPPASCGGAYHRATSGTPGAARRGRPWCWQTTMAPHPGCTSNPGRG